VHHFFFVALSRQPQEYVGAIVDLSPAGSGRMVIALAVFAMLGVLGRGRLWSREVPVAYLDSARFFLPSAWCLDTCVRGRMEGLVATLRVVAMLM
jgi:hypothetical protein